MVFLMLFDASDDGCQCKKATCGNEMTLSKRSDVSFEQEQVLETFHYSRNQVAIVTVETGNSSTATIHN
jgi:hypothetical protein